MPKLDPIEQALSKLGTLRALPPSPELFKELRDFLRNRSNLVVAKASTATPKHAFLAVPYVSTK
jgi:hypothetical protein